MTDHNTAEAMERLRKNGGLVIDEITVQFLVTVLTTTSTLDLHNLVKEARLRAFGEAA